MKKQMIMIAVMGAALWMSGCGADVNITASQPDGTQTGAVTETAAGQTETTVLSEDHEPVQLTNAATIAAADTATEAAGNGESGSPAAEANVDVSVLNGEWYYEEQDPQNGAVYNIEGYLTIDAGSYDYQPKNGSASKSGSIRLDYDEFGDGSRVPFFAFYDNDNSFWIGTYCPVSESDTYYLGNGGSARITKRNAIDAPLDEYVGQWQCDRCTITVADQGAGYGVEIHWADSASEDNVWTYSCVGSNDGTSLICYGGATLVHVAAAEDSTETRTEVYNDGTGAFRIRGGVLFWEDDKEDKGREMGFQKIG